jgi:uncharacterized repeat protein (TIGR03803 family)
MEERMTRPREHMAHLALAMAAAMLLTATPAAQGGITLLHEFAGGADDGRYPHGSLTLSGSTLYGMTSVGGDSDYGTVFALEIETIPEPISLIFFGTGVAGAFGFVMRKRTRRSISD